MSGYTLPRTTSRRLRILSMIGASCLASALMWPANAYANSPLPTGPHNAITDVPGVEVGQYTDQSAATGTTDLIFPNGALVGADPAGGSPGDRMTTLFMAGKQDLFYTPSHGIILNGGSSFGLEAACGLVNYLQQHGMGQKLFGTNYIVPQVPGAIIFDLTRGNDYRTKKTDVIPDTCAWGYRAAQAASSGPVQEGSVGAGTGAMSGGIKGGVGTASTDLGHGTYVGALVVVNSGGKTYNVNDKCELYTAYLEQDNEFGDLRTPPHGCRTTTGQNQASATPSATGGVDTNTTIGVIATNAALSPAEAVDLANLTSDGDARSIRPSHMGGNGDTVFAVSTAASHPGIDTGSFGTLAADAADAYSRAIDHAILSARNLGVAPTYCQTFAGACGPPGHSSESSAVTGNHAGSGPGAGSNASSGLASWTTANLGNWRITTPGTLLIAVLVWAWAARRRRAGRPTAQ